MQHKLSYTGDIHQLKQESTRIRTIQSDRVYYRREPFTPPLEW